MSLDSFVARVQVIASSVVTLFTAVAAAVTVAVNEIAPQLPTGWQDNAFQVSAVVVGVLASAVTALRRVTPVPADQRGVLPPS